MCGGQCSKHKYAIRCCECQLTKFRLSEPYFMHYAGTDSYHTQNFLVMKVWRIGPPTLFTIITLASSNLTQKFIFLLSQKILHAKQQHHLLIFIFASKTCPQILRMILFSVKIIKSFFKCTSVCRNLAGFIHFWVLSSSLINNET